MSLKINRERFGITPQLYNILRNTVAELNSAVVQHKAKES
jgi:hypothetical protein